MTEWATGSPRRVTAIAWAVAVLGPLMLSGILVEFRGELFTTNAALVLVLPVLAAAIVGGRWGGAASAVVAALCFDYFFTRPYYSFTINSRDDVGTTIVLLVVGLVVGELVVRTRRSRELASASRREVDQVRRVAELAAGRGSTGRLISVVEREVVDLLGARGARFERPPLSAARPGQRGRAPDLGPGPRDRSPRARAAARLDRGRDPSRRPRARGDARRPTGRGAGRVEQLTRRPPPGPNAPNRRGKVRRSGSAEH